MLFLSFQNFLKNRTKNSRQKQKSFQKLIGSLSLFAGFFLMPSLMSAQSGLNPADCSFAMPEKTQYEARIISVKRPGMIQQNEVFTSEVYIQNNGNVPWFSANSGCSSMVVNLGTEKKRDRSSIFFYSSLIENTGWIGANRIVMETPRVDPGQIGVFHFSSVAPAEAGIYREYYAPVIEGVSWINSGIFFRDIIVGEPDFDINKKELFPYIEESINLTKADFAAAEKRKKAQVNGTSQDVGGKSVEVSISKQRMYLKEDGEVIKEFVVSTGTYKTPTPLGKFKIFQKQPVRVASGKIKWIMPQWMQFKSGGYGIHALPSLANDKGVYWREALNHIGTRRSHGCIRLLPEDAKFTYEWAPVGTPVWVYN